MTRGDRSGGLSNFAVFDTVSALTQLRKPELRSASSALAILAADVLRKLMPLFSAVRAKGLHPVISSLSALQGLSNFPVIIVEHDSPKSYFFIELLPNRSEFSPVHESLLPLLFQARAIRGKRRKGPSSSAKEAPRPIMIWPRPKP
jgi:hypothetical protein